MAGTKQVGFLNPSSSSLRERAAKATLHSVRMQGHTYVELREDGKRFVFFCTLCLSPCYSDSVLFDHLKGNLHSQRLTTAKVTLLKANPWPFNDGVHFFTISNASNDGLTNLNANPVRSLQNNYNDKSLPFVSHNGNAESVAENSDSVGDLSDSLIPGSHSLGNRGECDMVIRDVLLLDKISDLGLKFIGFGKIGARFCEERVSKRMSRIWCEWLGKKDHSSEELHDIPEHDFAIVVFSHDNDLGRQSVVNAKRSLPPGMGNVERCIKKKKCFSDPEDSSESLNSPHDSSGEPSLPADCSPLRLALDQCNDQSSRFRNMSNRALRRELRQQEQLAKDRLCDICQQQMLPGKDVSALVNIRAERLVCSSRNVTGAFHVFHTSCLIKWILLCESEIFSNRLVPDVPVMPEDGHRYQKKSRTGTERKTTLRYSGTGWTGRPILSVFCPECQGTGVLMGGDCLERPTFLLPEVFNFKLKAGDGHKAWMKSPELLENCSLGFHFPSKLEETVKVEVSHLKILQFFRANLQARNV